MEGELYSRMKALVQIVPNAPKPGVFFTNMTPLFKTVEGRRYCIEALAKACPELDVVVGIDSRGLPIAALLADHLSKEYVPARKPGKLPSSLVIERSSTSEYGGSAISIEKGMIKKGAKVAIVDDVLATGRTAKMAQEIVEEMGGEVVAFLFLISIDELKGEAFLQKGCKEALVYSIFHFGQEDFVGSKTEDGVGV